MLYHAQRGRVPCAVHYTTRGNSNKGENESCCKVGDTPRPQGSQIILGVCQLLSLLCSWICGVGIPPDIPYEERCTMGVGPPQRQAFQRIKEALCNASLLQYPAPSLPYVVVTDASGQAAGGVLMQDQGEGLRPLAFMSRALKPTEQRYSAYKRELAAITYCFVQW